jgi:hypothetical protein
LFVGSIVLATYSLIREQQIAIHFVRQELLGTQYLGKLREVFAAILADESSENAERSLSVDSALDSLATAESQTAGSFDTAKLEKDVAAAVRKLSSEAPVRQKHALIVDALSKARDLAAQIGDDSKLALDPGPEQLLPAKFSCETGACVAFRNCGLACAYAWSCPEGFALE